MHHKRLDIIVIVVLIIYLISNINAPEFITNVVDTLFGKVALLALVLFVFMKHKNPLLGVLFMLAALNLVRNSTSLTGNYDLDQYLPSEFNKQKHLNNFNAHPYTLEQEIVSKMAPIKKTNADNDSNFVSSELDSHNAQML